MFDHLGKYWFSKNKPKDRLPICDRAIREDNSRPIEWLGMLTKLRRSGQWVKDHREEWPYQVPHTRLDFACLTARAERYAKDEGVPLDSVCLEWMRQGLQQLVGALNSPDARLLEDKIGDVVFEMNRFLRNNARLARERRQHPEIEPEQTHREPSQFMGSWNSLVERARSLSSEPLPPNEFGREQLAFMSGMVGRAVQFRESHPELEHRWMDVNYVDLVEEGSL
ncbi:MAG: hypothetical protein J4F37_04370 [Acidobacteria bacterium]|nr:hypothetical protein [Acidobacteriota bacterium]